MRSRFEGALKDPIWGRIRISGKQEWVEVTHCIVEDGHVSNRVKDERGKEHIVPNDRLDFSKRKPGRKS